MANQSWVALATAIAGFVVCAGFGWILTTDSMLTSTNMFAKIVPLLCGVTQIIVLC
jgi:hypothetical protein